MKNALALALLALAFTTLSAKTLTAKPLGVAPEQVQRVDEWTGHRRQSFLDSS